LIPSTLNSRKDANIADSRGKDIYMAGKRKGRIYSRWTYSRRREGEGVGGRVFLEGVASRNHSGTVSLKMRESSDCNTSSLTARSHVKGGGDRQMENLRLGWVD